jgi:hypothetical protein
MVTKRVVALSILAVGLATVSCRKLNQPGNPTGPLTYEQAKFVNAIPQDYGPLIGVTGNAKDPSWSALWFQRSDGTITAVFVNVQDGRLYEKVLTIPRK